MYVLDVTLLGHWTTKEINQNGSMHRSSNNKNVSQRNTYVKQPSDCSIYGVSLDPFYFT